MTGIKKKISVHMSNGEVYEGYRWVSQDTGQPVNTGKESKEIQEFKENTLSKIKDESTQDKEIENKIKEISEKSGTRAQRIRDFAGLGIYDPSLIMKLNPDTKLSNVDYYFKESGIDYKKLTDTLTYNFNSSLENEKTKEIPIYQLEQERSRKDLFKVLKDRKEKLGKELGITWRDRLESYQLHLDMLIGDHPTNMELIVYGNGSIVERFYLKEKLMEHGKVGWDTELDLQPNEYDYLKITGNISPSDLYNLIYPNRDKIIVFDGCDFMWNNEDCANMIKGACLNRTVHYSNPKKLPDGTSPPIDFKFSGQIIFFSKLPEEQLDAHLIDRCNVLDLTMSMDETLELLDSIKYTFNFQDTDKSEVLWYYSYSPLDVPKSVRDDIMKVLYEFKDKLRVEQINDSTLGNLAVLKLELVKKGNTSYDEFKKQAMMVFKTPLEAVLEELNSLTGLSQVKQEVHSLVSFIKVQKAREEAGLKSSSVSYHCVFSGNPGTGKTTIARIVAKIYKCLGVITQGQLIETDRSGLIAEYTGQTAIKVNKVMDSALNGILFIDEAYSLVGNNQDDYGKEAVATLIKRMEDDRDKLIVIVAGYTNEMKTFIDTNPGFKSRFNRYIEFADYSPDELLAIFKIECFKQDYKLSEDAENKLTIYFNTAWSKRDRTFGNGRLARNIFEQSLEKQANRISNNTSQNRKILMTITANDIPDTM